MNLFALILLSFAMSTDAFAAAISKGVKFKHIQLHNALKLGLIFGVIEAITPVIGWYIGRSTSSYIEAWDHWVALFLLCGLGIHMIYQSLNATNDRSNDGKNNPSLLVIILTAIGTSIDAMAVGVSLAFIDVNINIVAIMIGLTTFIMVTIGAMLGGVLGHIVGRKAETFGGLILIIAGIWLFIDHVM